MCPRARAECEANVKGYAGAQYKSFKTPAEAQQYLSTLAISRVPVVAPTVAPQHDFASQLSLLNVATRPHAAPAQSILIKNGRPAPPNIPENDVPESAAKRRKPLNPNLSSDKSNLPPSQVVPIGSSNLLTVYTDGACPGNGQGGNLRAGIGVYYPDKTHPHCKDDICERLPGQTQTNQRAELWAAARCIEDADPGIPLRLRSDSKYLVTGMWVIVPLSFLGSWLTSLAAMTSWVQKWNSTKGKWAKVENKDILQYLCYISAIRTAPVYWVRKWPVLVF
jgi:ribonuclease HI